MVKKWLCQDCKNVFHLDGLIRGDDGIWRCEFCDEVYKSNKRSSYKE